MSHQLSIVQKGRHGHFFLSIPPLKYTHTPSSRDRNRVLSMEFPNKVSRGTPILHIIRCFACALLAFVSMVSMPFCVAPTVPRRPPTVLLLCDRQHYNHQVGTRGSWPWRSRLQSTSPCCGEGGAVVLSFIKKLLFIVLPSFVFSRPLVDFFIRDFAMMELL